ncbi:malate synthase [Salmonella enterica subsp. enterica]|uniref:Malate synthase n=1 Tax=Salmonella enterica I TaxID=59201 RepID=A0A379X2J1_SALET|nr:malate synthase [Salmonella enterica subsp. enterica]
MILLCTFSTNYKALLAKGSGPYFYLPKTQAWQEAAWWSEVFSYAEDRFNLPRGTIKATLLIETLPAVFQMDEILHALRDHIVGLNCGRWDYIFSYIKTLKNHPGSRPAGQAGGNDGQTVSECLLAPADQNLPQARRVRDGRYGGVYPEQRR